MATQKGPKGSCGSHQNVGGQSKFSQDCVATEVIFLLRGLLTTLQEKHPQLLRDSGRKPDVVIASSSTDAFILVESTVPWEDRIEVSNVLKTEKYSE